MEKRSWTTLRMSAARRRSSSSDLPTHRRTPNSQASQRNLSSCAQRRRRRRINPVPQVVRALRPTVRYGRSMRRAAHRYWTRQARCVTSSLVHGFFARISLMRNEMQCSCYSRSRYCPLVPEATIARDCGNRCSSLTTAYPR